MVRVLAGEHCGTGVAVSRSGKVVTAAHVVEGQTRVQVAFPDGRTAEAAVLNANLNADIALLAIEGLDTVPTATIGDSLALRPGDDVAVVGYHDPVADGPEPALTPGTVSIFREGGGFTIIVTSCGVNPGDSGAPMVDRKGEVIGIVTSRAEETADGRPLQNIGFAVASHDVKRILGRLLMSLRR